MKEQHLLKGSLLMLLSSLSVAIMSVTAKFISSEVATTTVVFFQNFFSFLFILPAILHRNSGSLATKQHVWHLLRALTGAGAWYCMFLAMHSIPVSNAVLLTYTASIWLPILSWIFLKHSISHKVWQGIILGFIGIGLILGFKNQAIHMGSFIALTAGLLLAAALLTVRHLNHTEPAFRTLFYYFLFSSLLFFPLMLHNWCTIPLHIWPYLIAIGISLALSQLFVILAYHQAHPASLSPIMYSTILFTALLEWVVWDISLTTPMLFGMLLVISGGIIASREKSNRPLSY